MRNGNGRRARDKPRNHTETTREQRHTTSARLHKWVLRFYEEFSNLFKNKIKKKIEKIISACLNWGMENGVLFYFSRFHQS